MGEAEEPEGTMRRRREPVLLPPVAPYSIPDSAVEFEAQLDPFDPALAYFDCGTDATALAISAFFRGGNWVKHKGMVALRFVVGSARIGYAAVVMSRNPYPDSTGNQKAAYLAIWMMGLDQAFHGTGDPGSSSGSKLSDAVMRGCEVVAAANSAAGMSLWVREGNAPARRLYSRNGFFVDPRGVFQDHRGIDMLEMRKTLAA